MANPFLWNTGTSNNGIYGGSALTLMTTELNSLTSGSYATSSVGGTSGVFSTADTGAVILGSISWTFGGTITPASPLAIPCWFARTLDGSTFEDASNLLARGPDFVFAFSANSYASKTVYNNGGLVAIPSLKFKLIVLNNIGGTLPASGNVIKLAPMAVQV